MNTRSELTCSPRTPHTDPWASVASNVRVTVPQNTSNVFQAITQITVTVQNPGSTVLQGGFAPVDKCSKANLVGNAFSTINNGIMSFPSGLRFQIAGVYALCISPDNGVTWHQQNATNSFLLVNSMSRVDILRSCPSPRRPSNARIRCLLCPPRICAPLCVLPRAHGLRLHLGFSFSRCRALVLMTNLPHRSAAISRKYIYRFCPLRVLGGRMRYSGVRTACKPATVETETRI